MTGRVEWTTARWRASGRRTRRVAWVASSVVGFVVLVVLAIRVLTPIPHGVRWTDDRESRLSRGETVVWTAATTIARVALDPGASRAPSLPSRSAWVSVTGENLPELERSFRERLGTTFPDATLRRAAPWPPGDVVSVAHLAKRLVLHESSTADEEVDFLCGPALLSRSVRVRGIRWWGECRVPIENGWPRPRAFVVVLPTNDGDRAVVAPVARRRTLVETWSEVSRDLAATRPFQIDLVFPRVNFAGVAEAPLATGTPPRTGRVSGSAAVVLEPARETGMFTCMPMDAASEGETLFVDRPFLLALLERDATEPYFLAWIGNADLLEPAR